MTLQHLPRTARAEEAAGIIGEHGYVIIDELVPVATMTQIESELEPYLEPSPHGRPAHNRSSCIKTSCSTTTIRSRPTTRST